MSGRAQRISEVVKRYDSALFARWTPKGIHVMRKVEKYITPLADLEGSSGQHVFIMALTDDWNLRGSPVDWGIEPIMMEIRSRDQWALEGEFERMRVRREKMESDRVRERRNQNRAVAADLRKEFARATNDINTAQLR